MQPHYIFRPVLREQLEKLREEALSKNQSSAHTDMNDLVSIYIMKINDWVSTLTPIQLAREYTLNEIINLSKLHGYYKAKASNQFTGEALRRCGFMPKRAWTKSGRNKRYWKHTNESDH